MLGLKKWILGKRWILAAMPYFRHCETSARKSWQSTIHLYHSQAAKPLAQQLISPRKWILGSGRVWLIALGLLGALQCMDARKSPQYITDSKDFSTIGIDRHDIEAVVEKTTRKLLESSFVRELQGQKLLAIADLRNLTEEDIDVEFLSRKITRTLRKSKKFTLTNAIAGSGSSTDNLLTDSRKLTKDKRFNQYTTQEDGTLLAPDLSLSGKIIQRTKSVGDRVRVDYDFLFVLTDLKSGRVVWDDEENIAKAIDKSQVARFSKLGAGTCQGGDAIACEREAQAALDSSDYESAQELLKQACDLGNRQACENAAYLKRALKEQKKQEKKARKQARGGRFGLSVGADIGMRVSNTINIMPISYDTIPLSGGVGQGLIRYKEDVGTIHGTITYALKTGVWYQQRNGLYLSVNAIFHSYQTSTDQNRFQFVCTGDRYYGDCFKEGVALEQLVLDHKLLGGSVRIGFSGDYIEDSAHFVGFVGGGALTDISSTLKDSKTFSFGVNEKLNNTFIFWEAGVIVAPTNIIFGELSIRHILTGKDDKSWASNMSLNIGIGLLLPVW